MEKILEVSDLSIEFKIYEKTLKVVQGVGFNVYKGKTLGIVGESGSGKSLSALSIMGLVPFPGKVVSGKILYRGRDLLKCSPQQLRSIRGNNIGMIFQEPMSSLNPVMTIGYQIEEVLIVHRKELSASERKDIMMDMLSLVGIPSPEKRIFEYPHQLSGGMRQRVMMTMALCCKPDILIADEPTTALDVTIQAQILDLLEKIKEELGMGVIMITHDLGVVSEICDEVVVMYCGQVVEQGKKEDVFLNPSHPYTKGLLTSIPSMECSGDRLPTIEGMVPPVSELPLGCYFKDRCFNAKDACSNPQKLERKQNRAVRCAFPLG